MQLDTNKKKITAALISILIILTSGFLTIYGIKHIKTEQSKQSNTSVQETADTALTLEKEGEQLFNSGDLTAAKNRYQKAIDLYAETGDTVGKERVALQLSLVEHKLSTPPATQVDLSSVPIDPKLTTRLGTPAPIVQP
jgi:hypothetical protein